MPLGLVSTPLVGGGVGPELPDVIARPLTSGDPTATFSDYANVVSDALRGCGDDIVLVGHSMGGQTIPLVAARRPVAHLVYLCALVPNIGLSLAEQIRCEPRLERAFRDIYTGTQHAFISEKVAIDAAQIWLGIIEDHPGM